MDDPREQNQHATDLTIGSDVDGDDDIIDEITSLVSEEPRTVREVHETLGQQASLSRDQTQYRLNKLSDTGAIQSKKWDGRTSPIIYWSSESDRDKQL